MTASTAASPNLSRRQTVRKPAVRAKGGIVVSHNRLASEIGARVLAAGGHAVDAAVATSLAIGVLEPWMSGIGGSGAMLVCDARENRVSAFNFGARSPQALNPADYPLVEGSGGDLFGWPRVQGDRNLRGVWAASVPSHTAGIAAAHRAFGRRPWSELVQPSIALAADGPVVDWYTTLMVSRVFGDLMQDAGSRSVFLPGNVPPAPAQLANAPAVRLPNPALARTLEAIADGGADAFYRGPVMRALLDDLKAAGGVHAEADFAAASEVRTAAPRTMAYGQHTLHVVPELNGGPTILDALEGMTRRWKGGALDGAFFAAIAAGLQDAWQKRFATMGDSAQIAPHGSTTHLSVVDRDGNMVTLTQTLLSLFGSMFLSPSTGILLNNAINWFDPRPGGPNALAPGKRVLANYAPTVMTGPDDAIAIGGSGGRKILPAVFQLLMMMANGRSLDEAIHAPRIDVSGNEGVVVDRTLPQEVRNALAAQFSTVEVERGVFPYHFTIASAVRRQGGTNEGATEPYNPWGDAVSEEEV